MKTALIVDDSRLARTVLGRLLAEHGVAVDNAPSAEAALEYLKHRRPDVVFLDHNMPGMDGFEALEAIKANPVTATLPVMMYTSEEGELYVSQARALGAFGLLPKGLHPAEMTDVLRSLHLIAGEETRASIRSTLPASDESLRLRELMEELFYGQAAVVREEIRIELRRAAALRARQEAPPPAIAAPPPPAPAPGGSARRWRLAAVLAGVTALVFAALYERSSTLLRDAHERTARLALDAAELASAGALGARNADAVAEATLEALEWAANRDNRYAFGAVALDDARAVEIATLLAHLDEVGFMGTIAIDVHVGRFCMRYRDDGMLEPAAPDTPAASCDLIGWPEADAFALGAQQSIGFANEIAAATHRKPLSVAVQSFGSTVPLVEYPSPTYAATAGDWNAAAASNQRIEIRLLPGYAGG